MSGLELALVGEQRLDFWPGVTGDVLGVVWLLGLEKQKCLRSVMGNVVFDEEERVARGNDSVNREKPCVPVIGVQAVTLPRIMTEHHDRFEFPDPVGNLRSLTEATFEFPIGPAEEHHLARRSQPSRCFALFGLTGGDQVSLIDGRIPGSLRPIGAHEVMDHCPCCCPFGESRAALELGIIGVGDDRHRRGRRIEVDVHDVWFPSTVAVRTRRDR